MSSVTKDSSFVLSARLMISLSNLLFIPLLTKNLTTENYGIWAQVWITLPLVSDLLVLGFDEAMSRFFPSIGRKEYSRDFVSMLVPIMIISSGFCLIFYALSDQIASYLFNGNVVVVRLLSATIFVYVLDLAFYSVLRSLRMMRSYSLLSILQNIFEMGLATAFVIMGHGVEGAVTALLVTRSGIFIVLMVISKFRLSREMPKRYVLSKYVRYGLPTLPMVVSIWALASLDRYMIALFYDTTAVGFYDPAYTMGQSLPFLITGVLSFTLTPHLSKMFDSGNIIEVRKTMSFMAKLAMAINVPFILGGMLLARPVLELFSTELIAANGYRVLPLIAIGVTFHCFKVILSQTWKIRKKTHKLAVSYSSAALMNILLNYFLIPVYGIEGAAIATLLAYGIDLLITVLWLRRDIIPAICPKNLIKIGLGSLTMFIAVYLAYYHSPIHSTVLPILIGIVIYIFLIRHLNILDDEERIVIKELKIINRFF